jgi:hypothetical protein
VVEPSTPPARTRLFKESDYAPVRSIRFSDVDLARMDRVIRFVPV